MVSLIDPTVPIYGRTPGPSTLSVRTNFQHAKDEVEALQNTRLHRSAGPTNPLTGPLFLFNEPIGAPTVAVRSPGTRIVLFNGLTATTFDYALGIENNTLWFSANGFFRWYLSTASNNPVATLDNTGLRLTGRLAASELEARGTTSAASSLRLAGVAGTQGIRVNHAPGFSTIEGVDNSFTATYETLRLYGARLQLGSQGGAVNQIDLAGNTIALNNSLTVLTAANNDLLRLNVTGEPGYWNRIMFQRNTTNIWAAGLDPSDNFQIWDERAAAWRLSIGAAGLVTVGQNLTVIGTTTLNGLLTAAGPGRIIATSGGNPGLSMNNTGAGPVYAISVGGIPAYLHLGIADPVTGNPTTQLVRIDASNFSLLTNDLVLDRRDQATAFISRPNLAGFRNLTLAAIGDTPLDVLTFRAANVWATGPLLWNMAIGPPIATGRALGARLVLFPGTGDTAELAIGIAGSMMWFGNRGGADVFAWFSGPTEIARLHGTGRMTIAADPINPLDVATKRYVDGAFDDLRDATETRLAALEARIAHMGV